MRALRRRLVLALALAPLLGGVSAVAAGGECGAPVRAKRSPSPLRKRAAAAPAALGRSPFQTRTLLAHIASGDEAVIDFDRAGGASGPADPSSRFVLIRDAVGQAHILGILTPHTGRQATSIFDSDVLTAGEVGAVFRAVLEADRAAAGRVVAGWRARVNLPARISQDILHVHGDEGGRGAPLTGTSVAKGDFQLHDGPELAARATVLVSRLDAAHEDLLGRMVLEVARLAKARHITDGSIEVSRTDAQLTVRLETSGRFTFGSDE